MLNRPSRLGDRDEAGEEEKAYMIGTKGAGKTGRRNGKKKKLVIKPVEEAEEPGPWNEDGDISDLLEDAELNDLAREHKARSKQHFLEDDSPRSVDIEVVGFDSKEERLQGAREHPSSISMITSTLGGRCLVMGVSLVALSMVAMSVFSGSVSQEEKPLVESGPQLRRKMWTRVTNGTKCSSSTNVMKLDDCPSFSGNLKLENECTFQNFWVDSCQSMCELSAVCGGYSYNSKGRLCALDIDGTCREDAKDSVVKDNQFDTFFKPDYKPPPPTTRPTAVPADAKTGGDAGAVIIAPPPGDYLEGTRVNFTAASSAAAGICWCKALDCTPECAKQEGEKPCSTGSSEESGFELSRTVSDDPVEVAAVACSIDGVSGTVASARYKVTTPKPTAFPTPLPSSQSSVATPEPTTLKPTTEPTTP